MTALSIALRAHERHMRERHLSSVVEACRERLRHFECDGALIVVREEYRAALSDSETTRLQALIAFGLLSPFMARAMRKPAPTQATA